VKKKPVRRKTSAARRLRPFRIVILAIAAVAAAAGYYAASWPGFYPQRILVTGNVTVPSQEILRRAAIGARRNVWLMNVRAACRRVETIPYVATCAIHRTLPAAVRLQIVERRPFADVVGIGQTALVDERLRVLEAGSRAGFPRLIDLTLQIPAPGAFLHAAAAQHLRDDSERLTAGHVFAQTLALDKFGQLNATLADGIAVYFGDERNLARTIPLVNPIVSQVASKGRPVRAIDLRAPQTPVVVYRK
jgi:cell division septal protein FtsQ